MSRTRRFLVLAIAALLLGLLILPWLQKIPGNGWKASAFRLRTVGLGLHHYEEFHGRLPSRVVMSKEGEALYSWRVALLPFLEYDPLHKEFKLDEPSQ